MAHRSTTEQFTAQAKARDLSVKDGLSLEAMHQQTGETRKTLRAWRNLGERKTRKAENAKTELDRLKDLRIRLLDHAEAQLKAGTLPHTEMGLMSKLEQMTAEREEKQGLPETVGLLALRPCGPRMSHRGGGPAATDRKMLLECGKSISAQGFPRLPQCAR